MHCKIHPTQYNHTNETFNSLKDFLQCFLFPSVNRKILLKFAKLWKIIFTFSYTNIHFLHMKHLFGGYASRRVFFYYHFECAVLLEMHVKYMLCVFFLVYVVSDFSVFCVFNSSLYFPVKWKNNLSFNTKQPFQTYKHPQKWHQMHDT